MIPWGWCCRHQLFDCGIPANSSWILQSSAFSVPSSSSHQGVYQKQVKSQPNASIHEGNFRSFSKQIILCNFNSYYFKKSCELHWVSKHGKCLFLVPLFLFCSFVNKLSSFSVTFRKLWRIFNLASDALGGAVAWIIRHIELLLSWLDLVYLL